METTVYQSNLNIFHKSINLLISSILNGNNLATFQMKIYRESQDAIRINVKSVGVNTSNWIDAAQGRHYGELLGMRH